MLRKTFHDPAKLLRFKEILYGALLISCAALRNPIFCESAFAAPLPHQGCFGQISAPACDGSSPAAIAAQKRAKFSKPILSKVTPLPSAITAPSFRQINSSLGEWSGTINGTGEIHLTLQISNRGAVLASRYIGNVHLVDHPTTFLRSATPSTAGWEWKILAFAGTSATSSKL